MKIDMTIVKKKCICGNYFEAGIWDKRCPICQAKEVKVYTNARQISKKLGMTAEQTYDYFAMIEAH